MNTLSFCTQPGSAYPWSAVRRYIYENQGFMKRMYGENRQSQVVREEIARMNDRYDVMSTAAFRSAKSDVNTVNENDLNESANTNTEKNIEFGQTSSVLLNETLTANSNNISKEQDNVEAEGEANLYTTTVGDNLASAFSLTKGTLEDGVEVREENSATTPLDIDNALSDEVEPEKPVKGYNACPIVQEVVSPFWANSTRGQTLALLNVYPFEQ